jgi:hypothetical protein
VPTRLIPLSSLVLLTLLAACDDSPDPLGPAAPPDPSLSSAEVSGENFVIPIEATFDCTAAGGEIIDVSGNLHVTDRSIQQEDGSFQLIITSNAQGITGTGRSTGARYQAPGMGLFTLLVAGAGSTTFLDLTHLVRTGPGGDGTIWGAKFITHLTVTPTGQFIEHTVDAGDCVQL